MSRVLPTVGHIPEWSIHERLAKALKHSGLRPEELAVRMDISKGTVENWITGRVKRISRGNIILWAQETGVDADWLLTGKRPVNAESPPLKP